MSYFASDMNMELLQKEIKRLQTDFHCKMCKQHYTKEWCPADESSCMFCIRYNPKMTRMMILRDMEWCYIKSGWEDHIAYYREFNKYLHLWCNRYHITQTQEEYDYIQEKLES